MRLARRALVSAVVGATLIASAAPVMASSPASEDGPRGAVAREHNRPGPFTARQEARRKAAQKLILSGKAAPDEDGVIALGADKYVEASVTGTGQVFTILAEFGDLGSGKLGRVPGPLHNEIAPPNRPSIPGYNAALPLDNSTHWVDDFTPDYYRDLFFAERDGTFKDFYEKQSSGLYTVDGGVTEWVKVPGNASLYGDNTVEDFGGAWQFIADTGNAWWDAQIAANRTPAEIKAELAQYDVWDRNDHDGDGNFDEPDGYIDHFQAVHAGEGEDAGGGAQGADAIWSHRWYVNDQDFGITGPTVGGEEVFFGGTEIGDSGIWIGDYTVEAENGGLGVFAHEFAHDLGLPDLYDTAGGDNGTGFWTVMSLGSWLNEGGDDIGTKPNFMGPWEKLQLGWLDYEVVSEGGSGEFTLSPAALQVAEQAQAVIVDVPDQSAEDEYTTPFSGATAWWTSSADDLNTTLTRTVNLTGVRSATVTAKAWYDIEEGYDFLYAEYSTNGDDWIAAGDPVDGSSAGRWTTLRYSIPGGAQTQFRFRYQSDTGVALPGAFLDDITIKSGGTTLLSDDVESGDDNDWTAEGGFKRSTGTEERLGDRYYIAENRAYVSYDATLEVGPYQFSFALTAPNRVERFPAQDGLLVWMVDETWNDNDTINHPGHGQALPVDARPIQFQYSDGTAPTNRRQPFDATFGLQDVPEEPGLHKEVVVGKGKTQSVGTLEAWPTAEEREAIPVFDDTDEDAYWDPDNPLSSTLVAGHGVTITVTEQNAGGTMTIEVNNPG